MKSGRLAVTERSCAAFGRSSGGASGTPRGDTGMAAAAAASRSGVLVQAGVGGEELSDVTEAVVAVGALDVSGGVAGLRRGAPLVEAVGEAVEALAAVALREAAAVAARAAAKATAVAAECASGAPRRARMPRSGGRLLRLPWSALLATAWRLDQGKTLLRGPSRR